MIKIWAESATLMQDLQDQTRMILKKGCFSKLRYQKDLDM